MSTATSNQFPGVTLVFASPSDLAGVTMDWYDLSTKEFALIDKTFTGTISSIFKFELQAKLMSDGNGLELDGRVNVDNDKGKINVIEMLNNFFPSGLELPEEFLSIELSSFQLCIDPSGFSIEAEIDYTVNMGIGSFKTKNLTISYHSKDEETEFNMSIISTFKPAYCEFSLGGALNFELNNAKIGFEFTPDQSMPPVSIPLPLPQGKNGPVKIDLAVTKVSVINDPAKGWAASISCSAEFVNMYQKICGIFCNSITASISIDKDGAELSIDRITQPVVLDIRPPIRDLYLGKMSFNFTNITINLKTPVSIEAELDIALPRELNKMFGCYNGEPCVEVFRCYDPEKPDYNAIKTKFIASENQITITLVNSPLQMITIEDGYVIYSMGKDAKYGEIRFKLPQFSYDPETMAFSASGGIEITRDIKIPMLLFKALFDRPGLKQFSEILPESIPLKTIEIFNPETGKINTDKLLDMFGDILPEDIVKVINIFEDQAGKLPEKLKEYLNIEIPRSFYFDCKITQTGDLNLALSVNNPLAKEKTNNPPVRLLVPAVGSMGPLLIGMEFYSFSFGEIISGSLLTCSVDMEYEVFNLYPIVAGLQIPEDYRNWISDSRDYRTGVSIRNLFMIIIYETTVPVPIPIFFDDAGYDYYSIDGVRICAHLGFPQPSLDLGEIAKIIIALEKFFIDRNTLMPTTAPKNMTPRFLIGKRTDKDKNTGNPVLFALPKYLGEKSLNIEYTDINPYSAVAHFMNWVKTFSPNELIQSIDPQKRQGKEKIKFFGLNADVKWVITTPKDFKERTCTYLEVQSRADMMSVADMLSLIPQDSITDDNGMVVLMNGGIRLTRSLSLESAFALAYSKDGFNTGFRMHGTINKLIEMLWTGSIGLNLENKGMPLSLNASAFMKVNKQDIIQGILTLNKQELNLNGKIDLFPGNTIVRAEGKISGNIISDSFLLDGDINIEAGRVKIISGKATLSDKGLMLRGQFLNCDTSFKLSVLQSGLILRGRSKITLHMKILTGPVKIGGIVIRDGIHFDSSVNIELDSSISNMGFCAELRARVNFLNQIEEFTNAIDVVPRSISDLEKMITVAFDKFLLKQAEQYYSDAKHFVEHVTRGVIKYSGDPGVFVGSILNNVYKISGENAAIIMKNANMCINEVKNALENSYNLATDQVNNALIKADYTADQIINVMGSLKDKIEDLFKLP